MGGDQGTREVALAVMATTLAGGHLPADCLHDRLRRVSSTLRLTMAFAVRCRCW
jgi:hypothetical protein